MNVVSKRATIAVIAATVALLAAACVQPGGGQPPPPKLVEAGGVHSCEVDATSQVACWGKNAKGQLGVGTFVDSPTPLYVPGMSSVTAVTASYEHSCAIKTGEVWCWGSNVQGQLGDGSTIDRPSPVQVGALAGITAISSGIAHSCALNNSQEVWCWGDNAQGQLGNGTTADSLTPVQVTGLTDAVTISVKGLHSCALSVTGTTNCWGDNSTGQLGIGSNVDSSVPVSPAGIPTATALEVGTLHTCATAAGVTSCWGNNAYGQLGNGSLTGSQLPVEVPGLPSNTTGLAMGAFHSCAVVNGGTAECWGYNLKGGLGDGTLVNSSTPVSVVGLAGITHMSAGLSHTCAVVSGTQVVCWGDNGVGQLGNSGAGSESTTPVPVDDAVAPPPVLPPNNVTTVSNYDLDCEATLNGTPVQSHVVAAEASVSHPSDILPGQTFHTIVTSADVDIPTTYPPGVTLENMSSFSVRVSIPNNTTLLSVSNTPGVNIGVGTPTVTDNGTYVQLDVPGPFAPGTTATLPSIDMELQTTGASGETIEFIAPGTSYGDWDYAFNVALAGIGTVANTCFVDPSPVLGSTPIT